MTFEGSVLGATATALAASAIHGVLTRSAVSRRRLAAPHVRTMCDGRGEWIEYAVSAPQDRSRPVVLLEADLRSTLEVWDQVAEYLSGEYWVLRYHRPGIGRTSSTLRPSKLVPRMLHVLDLATQDLHLVGHGIGTLVHLNSLLETPDLQERCRSVTGIDAPDGERLTVQRLDRSRMAQVRQEYRQIGLASLLGIDTWLTHGAEPAPGESETRRQTILVEGARPAHLRAWFREFGQEPIPPVAAIKALPLNKLVLAASDLEQQQRALAQKWGAACKVVPGSTHDSLVAVPTSVQVVLRHLRDVIEAGA